MTNEKIVAKPRQKQFTSSEGNNFTLQTVPNSTYLEIMDTSVKKDGNPALSKLYPAMLEHVVVQPSGLTPDDFDTFKEMQEVCEEALTFQQS